MRNTEQIKAAISEISAGQLITRENYRYFADQVIPRNDFPVREARTKMQGSPEGDVYLEVQNLNTRDWLDMACFRAAINQNKLAAERGRP